MNRFICKLSDDYLAPVSLEITTVSHYLSNAVENYGRNLCYKP